MIRKFRRRVLRLLKRKRFLMGFITGIVLVVLVLLYIGGSQEHKISLRGECGVVMGTLMNKIGTKGDCRVQCLNECISADFEFSKSEFIAGDNTSCNSCECYCK